VYSPLPLSQTVLSTSLHLPSSLQQLLDTNHTPKIQLE
jgi:hypothetical protein